MEFSSGKLWVVCTLCPTLDAALAAFCLSRFHVSPLFTVDEIMRITPRLINILLLNLPPHLQCLNFLVRHSSTYFLSLLSLFPPLNPQRYLWISFSIFGKNIYFKREITASQLPSSSYPAICSILILFCLFLLCERAEAEAWQPGLRHASLHLSKPSSLTPPLPSPLSSRCELCVCHLSESSAGSCTFPKTPASRSTMLSWPLARSTASSTQATGPSTHSA